MRTDRKEPVDQEKVRSKRQFVIMICVCFVLIISTGLLGLRFDFVKEAAHTIFSPIEKSIAYVTEWISDHTEGLKTIGELVDENNRLKDQIAALKEENRVLSERASALSEMEELMGLTTGVDEYVKVAAQIIALSPNNWYETFIINKGSQDGLMNYMPVLSQGGVVGHISRVYAHYSVVTSIVDESSVIYARISRQGGSPVTLTGAFGFSSNELGDLGNDICMIRFVTDELDIVIGDEIVTSSVGDIYPPGLLIGYVTDIVPLGSGYESVALVRPAASLSQVERVLVITDLYKADLEEELSGGDEP